jgi:hypothetical protein
MRTFPSRFGIAAAAFGLLAATTALAQTVDGFAITKSQDYLQTSPATPVNHLIAGIPNGMYDFDAVVVGGNLNLLNPAPKITLPNSTQYALTDGDPSGHTMFLLTNSVTPKDFTNKSALDAAFPNGAYVVNVSSTKLALTVGPTDTYPAEIPMVTNGTWDGQGNLVVNAATGATLNFNSFSAYTGGGLITFDLYAYSGNTLGANLASAQSLFLSGSQSDPALTAYAIPAGLLQPNQTYYVEVAFGRISSLNTSNPLGAVGFVAFVDFTGLVISTGSVAAAPAITSQPANQTVTVGASASFSAAASGSPAPTYQWQRWSAGTGGPWTSLVDSAYWTGTIAGTLTVYNTTLDMSGDQFRCVVTNSGGSATTNSATLTVNPAAVINAISYNSTNFPAAAAAGTAVSFTYNVTNTGTNPWGANHYLVLRDPANNNLAFASLNGVGPGASTTATLSFTSPANPGHYTYYVQGMENNVAYFSARATVTLAIGSVAADFNGDGKADILWSNSVNGDRYFWLMNGTSLGASVFLGTVAPQWTVATGDFNGDGKADLLWSNTASGDRYVWLMNGTAVSASVFLGTVAPQWTVTAGDVNGDGKADLLWSNTVNGDRYIWLMNGTTLTSAVFLGTVAPAWTVTTGDFNGDGKADLLWSSTVNGDRYVWLMNGTTLSSAVFLGTVAPQWTVSTGDFNGDGKADLLWSSTVNGDRYLWLMNGTTLGSSVYLANVSTDWSAGN